MSFDLKAFDFLSGHRWVTTVAAKLLDTLFFCDIFFIRERNFMKFSQSTFQHLPRFLLFRYFIVIQVFEALSIDS